MKQAKKITLICLICFSLGQKARPFLASCLPPHHCLNDNPTLHSLHLKRVHIYKPETVNIAWLHSTPMCHFKPHDFFIVFPSAGRRKSREMVKEGHLSYNAWMHHCCRWLRAWLPLRGQGPVCACLSQKSALEWLLAASVETDYTALHNCCFNPLSEEI